MCLLYLYQGFGNGRMHGKVSSGQSYWPIDIFNLQKENQMKEFKAKCGSGGCAIDKNMPFMAIVDGKVVIMLVSVDAK